MNKFYVYAYLREDRYSPYYIGKGTGKRWRQDCHRKGTKRPKDLSRIVKVKENLTEEEAFALEKLLILQYGKKIDGGILYNYSDGGQGGNNRSGSLSEEHKAKIGASVCRKITIGDKTFPSINQAAKELGVTRGYIWKLKSQGRLSLLANRLEKAY